MENLTEYKSLKIGDVVKGGFKVVEITIEEQKYFGDVCTYVWAFVQKGNVKRVVWVNESGKAGNFRTSPNFFSQGNKWDTW
tara:strand:+ start:702 stop:944 length:243 start_codon:yes stop_codon:yes gene_type:complete